MGSALGALFVGSKVAEPLIQHYETNRQMNFQSEENSINRDWQTVEAEKARQFSAQQLQKEMDYNSPVYQANELSKAGINPVIAMSGGKGVASVSGGSSAPVASPVGGVSPVQAQPIDLQIPQLMNGVGSMFKNLAEAKQLGVNTDILTKSAEYLIKNNMLTAEQKELGNSLLAINRYIEDEVKDAKISRAWDESKKAMYDAVISSNEADRGNLISRVLESQEALNNALSCYHGNNAELVALEVANFSKKLNAYLALAGAQADEARAGATDKRASAGLKYSQTDAQEIANNLSRGVYDAKLQSMLSEFAKSDQENRANYQKALTMYEYYKRLHDNNDNSAASYLNYTLWFIKENCPSLPIIPFLKFGK